MLGYVILLSYTPKHETNIILGDFNARLMERLPHETETLGEHLFREDESRIEQLSLAQQDNRTRFISFRQEHDLTVVNTLFQKDKSKLITYRNVAAPNFHPPYTLDRYGQLDFILINRKWKNAVTNAESNLQTSVTTDHKLLVANIRTKLAAKKQSCQTRSARYRTPTTEQIHRYN